jgi:malonyl CoA-acyl carrier protein transacylase
MLPITLSRDAIALAQALEAHGGSYFGNACRLSGLMESDNPITVETAERLREQLALTELRAPLLPLVNNIDVAVETDPARIRDALVRQAFGPVRWVECVQALKARGVRNLVECGPGKVLAGLVKRIDPELNGLALADPNSLAEVKVALA